MAKEDLPFLAFTWLGKIYINASMAFGSTSSCKIFKHVASVLQWIVTHITHWKWISHYLDDFPMLAKTKPDLFKQIERYLALMKKIGNACGRRENSRTHPVPGVLRYAAKFAHPYPPDP